MLIDPFDTQRPEFDNIGHNTNLILHFNAADASYPMKANCN